MLTRRRRLALLALAALLATAYGTQRTFLPRARALLGVQPLFIVEPYLQRGDSPRPGPDGLETLALLWQTADTPRHQENPWSVEVRPAPNLPWSPTPLPTSRRLAFANAYPFPFRLHRAKLPNLRPGATFAYRVLRDGLPVFESGGLAPRPPGQPQRFVVFGDAAAGTWGQNEVAYQVHRARPDYVVLTGDLVYYRGRVEEYLDHFFPVYNAPDASPGAGAPLLRSTLFFAAPGNHDLIERNLARFPDGLAYFYYWDQPLNGPDRPPGAPGTPTLTGGSPALQRAYLDAAGPAYPRMANFSFDYGDVHWTVLDANPYVDFADPALLAWLDADLAAASHARWRLVALHHPPFHSSRTHAEDQRSRLLAPAFEKGKVAVVFGGHVHNYQRSRPLRFAPRRLRLGEVQGDLTIDTAYDGANRIHPDGVIYLVTGAGGARLYDPAQDRDPASWQDYTARLISDVHSLTVVDADHDSLTVRQVSASGAEIDRFVVGRPGGPEVEASR